MEVSKERIREIANLTVGQRDNPLWHEYRKNRFTASQFGKILTSYEAIYDGEWNLDFHYLKNEILGNKPVIVVPAMVWGQDHEAAAIREYERKTGTKVCPTGIWLFPNGHFAASPDGLIFDPKDKSKPIGVVEVKCPWRLRNVRIQNESDWNAHLDYLDRWNHLVPTHPYYHQIQAEMIATNVDWCDFVIWCPSGLLISRIYLNKGWEGETIGRLERIYKGNFGREEDFQFFSYRRNPDQMQEIKLSDILSLTTNARRRIYRTFIYALAIHLARWCKKLRVLRSEQLTVQESIVKYIGDAKNLICPTCLVKLFMFQWHFRHREEELPDEIIQIRNCKWEIPSPIMALAEKKAGAITIDAFFTWDPCMCVKL